MPWLDLARLIFKLNQAFAQTIFRGIAFIIIIISIPIYIEFKLLQPGLIFSKIYIF